MLTFTRQRLGHTTVLHCSGRIVFPDAHALIAAVLQLPRTRKLVLDMADVILVDAAGLGALASLHCWAKKARIELKLMNVTSKLRTLLKVSRLDTFVESCSVPEMLRLLYCCSDDPEESLAVDWRSNPGARCLDTTQASAIGR